MTLINHLLFHLLFNTRSEPKKITVGVNERGETLIYMPGCTTPILVKYGLPLDIEISGAANPEVIQMRATMTPPLSVGADQPPP